MGLGERLEQPVLKFSVKRICTLARWVYLHQYCLLTIRVNINYELVRVRLVYHRQILAIVDLHHFAERAL